MAQNSQTESTQHTQEQNSQATDLLDEFDIQLPTARSVYDKIYDMTEKFASTRIGQYVIERGDRVLKVIENTAKWSLPQDKQENELERPLPWIPFISLIVYLRLIRVWLSVAAIMIGNGPVTPYDVVYFIQTRRRKLRAIRVHGLKEIRRHEIESQQPQSGDTSTGLMGKMKQLLSSSICRPGSQGEAVRYIFITQGSKKFNVKDNAENKATKRQRDEDCDDINLTVDEMLTRYANANSEDDSDFVPNLDDDDDDDDSTSNVSTSSDETPSENMEKKETNEKDVKKAEENNQQKNKIDDGNKQLPSDEKEQKNEVAVKKVVEDDEAVVDEEEEEEEENGNEEVEVEEEIVEIKENGGRERPVPRPIEEIKKEPASDIDSGNEQMHTPTTETETETETPKENGPSNGGAENREVDVVKFANSTPLTSNTHAKAAHKLTAGHENSAAKVRSKVAPSFGATANAGSPPDFNACYKPVSILKKSNAQAHVVDADTASNQDKPMSDSSSMGQKKHVTHQQKTQQKQQNQHHQFRNRNRNRR